MISEDQKLYIILNPTAGDGQAQGRWRKFKVELDAENIPYVVSQTEYQYHAAELAADAVERGVKKLAVFSGDGTLNEVLQGIMENDKLKNPELKLIFLPAGSSCDFEKKFENRRNWIERLMANDAIKIDIFKVKCKNKNGESVQRYIINNSSIGVISLANEKFNAVSGLSKKIKQWSVDAGAILSGIQALLDFQPISCTIMVNSDSIPAKKMSNITVFKTSHFGGDMHYGIKPVQDDGQLSVVVIKAGSRLELFSMMPSLFMGTVLKKKSASLYNGQTVFVDTEEDAIIEADGENIGKPPAEYTILPKAVNIIV